MLGFTHVFFRSLGGESTTAIDPKSGLASAIPGINSVAAGMLTPTGDLDLRKIGQARNTLMDLKLKQVTVIFMDFFVFRYSLLLHCRAPTLCPDRLWLTQRVTSPIFSL